MKSIRWSGEPVSVSLAQQSGPPFLNPVSQPSPAGYFELDSGKAREIVAHVGRAVSSWRNEGARQGLARGGIGLPSAFVHDDRLETQRNHHGRKEGFEESRLSRVLRRIWLPF
jgi:hypothetical protein